MQQASATTISGRTADGPHGPVPLRVYLPLPESSVGFGVVWVHGGGFRVGDLDMPEADWAARFLAARGITVVSVDYRLAVDGVHYPVPGDDVLAAWEWAQRETKLGVPDGRWSIGGGSAGATLAQSVTMRVRDAGGSLPRRVALVYPALHGRLPDAPPELARKRRLMPPPMRFDEASVLEHGENYAGGRAQMADPLVFPGEATVEQLVGLPPTLIVNADLDDLRASGQQFAAQLVQAGTDVAVVRELGVFHGHLAFPSFPQAQATMQRIAEWVTTTSIAGHAHVDDRDGWHLPEAVPTIWEQDAARVARASVQDATAN